MTMALLVLVCLVSCNDDDDGDGTPARNDAGVVDTGMPDSETCNRSGTCTKGVMCGFGCCASGERCVDGVCKCGEGPACDGGDSCVYGGPLLPSHGCGRICCGVTMGCPI